MNRKRAWEVASAASLVLITLLGGGFCAYRAWLNHELSSVLEFYPPSLIKVRPLLRRGADPNTHGHVSGTTPLIAFAGAGDEAGVLWMLSRGVPINATDNNGHTALEEVMERLQPATVRILLDRGAGPTERIQAGRMVAKLRPAWLDYLTWDGNGPSSNKRRKEFARRYEAVNQVLLQWQVSKRRAVSAR